MTGPNAGPNTAEPNQDVLMWQGIARILGGVYVGFGLILSPIVLLMLVAGGAGILLYLFAFFMLAFLVGGFGAFYARGRARYLVTACSVAICLLVPIGTIVGPIMLVAQKTLRQWETGTADQNAPAASRVPSFMGRLPLVFEYIERSAAERESLAGPPAADAQEPAPPREAHE